MYAIDSSSRLNNIDVQYAIDNRDCILLLLTFIYCNKNNLHTWCKNLRDYAKEIVKSNDVDQFWLFVYECLKSGSLDNEWAALKRANISFL